MGEVRYRTPCNFVKHYEFCKIRYSESHILNKDVIHIFHYFLYLSDVEWIGQWYLHRSTFGVLWTEAQWKQSFRYGCKLISKYVRHIYWLISVQLLITKSANNSVVYLWALWKSAYGRPYFPNGRKLNNVCTVKQYHTLKIKNFSVLRVISGFPREADENCAILGCYAASSDNSLTTFRENIKVPF